MENLYDKYGSIEAIKPPKYLLEYYYENKHFQGRLCYQHVNYLRVLEDVPLLEDKHCYPFLIEWINKMLVKHKDHLLSDESVLDNYPSKVLPEVEVKVNVKDKKWWFW